MHILTNSSGKLKRGEHFPIHFMRLSLSGNQNESLQEENTTENNTS